MVPWRLEAEGERRNHSRLRLLLFAGRVAKACALRQVAFGWKLRRKVRVRVGEQLREIWRQAVGGDRKAEITASAEAERKTLALPSILSPVQFPGRLLPKPTPMNLRRFAETPVVRRAINVIKDRIAAMDWQVRVRRGFRQQDLAFTERKLRALRLMLEEPNAVG